MAVRFSCDRPLPLVVITRSPYIRLTPKLRESLANFTSNRETLTLALASYMESLSFHSLIFTTGNEFHVT